VITVGLIGIGLSELTPFTRLGSGGIALLLAVMGFFGGVVMSAVKRDAGIKDFSHLIAGHGGVLDRVDSLCFAAPVLFHVVRYYFT
jgi:phosphatidate cytidylyltransferase